MKKERLDKVLVDLGYFESKSKAAASILAGNVMIGTEVITKAGYQIDISKEYGFKVKSMPYVSRGGFKLEKALKTFDIDVKDRICLDAGASTGGFTDCLLQNGAKFVYAADVGYGQLDWKIRNSEKVKTIEKTNLRVCSFSDIYAENEPVADLLVSDLSFISLEKILPNLKTLMNKDFHEMICLIKPQFEAGKEFVEKGGVVKDKAVHQRVIENVVNCVKDLNYTILGLTFSSIKGPAGNIEYLIWFSTQEENVDLPIISEVVESAHNSLN
ncbi:MAG: TlyA family RNA methyltransferase [bacterium]|nr:TlyA family RNA methyltransferase [bacterium]